MSKAQNLLFIQSIISKDTSKAKSILSKGANINAINESEHISALHYAVIQGDLPMMKFLIEEGADLCVRSTNGGQMPIHVACMKGNLEALKFLLECFEKKFHNDSTDSQQQVDSNDAQTSSSAPPTKKRKLNDSTAVASSNNNPKTLEAYINVQDENGWTPLICAASFSHLNVMDFLLKDKKADVNLTDNKQRNALQFIIANAQQPIEPKVVECLLEHNCDLNQQDKDQRTSLHLAVINSRKKEILRFLILYGVDTKAKDKRGNTAEKIATDMDKQKVADFIGMLREQKKVTEWMLKRVADGKSIPETRTIPATSRRSNAST